LTEEEVVMDTATALRDLVEPLVTAAGLEVWDVETGPGLVRVLVDRPGGVDLDALGSLNTTISRALDAAPTAAPSGRYQLEVSSPGVERPLRTPGHFARFVGETVAVKTVPGAEGSRRVRGLLRAVDAAGISVAPEDEPGGAELHISFDDIQKAHPVLIWGPSPKPGRGRATGSTGGARSNRVPAKDTAR
jgi:ribosome maturation factor RimP